MIVSVSDSTAAKSGPASRPDLSHGQNVEATQPVLGDCLALIGALFYALYVIILKVRVGEESRIDMQLFFGFVGLFNILTCWPLGIVLHLTGVEKFELPSSQEAVIAVLVNVSFAAVLLLSNKSLTCQRWS